MKSKDHQLLSQEICGDGCKLEGSFRAKGAFTNHAQTQLKSSSSEKDEYIITNLPPTSLISQVTRLLTNSHILVREVVCVDNISVNNLHCHYLFLAWLNGQIFLFLSKREEQNANVCTGSCLQSFNCLHFFDQLVDRFYQRQNSIQNAKTTDWGKQFEKGNWFVQCRKKLTKPAALLNQPFTNYFTEETHHFK